MHTQSSASLHGVLHNKIEEYWPFVSPYIEAALVYADGKHTLETVKEALLDRDMQLWIAIGDGRVEAAAVTQCVRFPSGKGVCNVMFCGGKDHTRWIHFLEYVNEWAKEQGCQSMEVWGRPGWKKLLPDWEQIHVVLRKTIT